MDDDDIWRKRLLLYSLVRAIGLVIFFLGLATIYTDLLRTGGWPQLGAVIAILGAIGALLLPRLLRRRWSRRERNAISSGEERVNDQASRPKRD